MLLTKKTEYALLSLISISKSDVPKNVDDLSNELGISKSFLAKVLQNLAKNSILISYKGANGGFALAKEPEKLTIFEITLAAEERIPPVFECTPEPCSCPSLNAGCTIWPMLANLQHKVNDFLNNLTLKDIIG